MTQRSVARSDLWSEAAPTSMERISASSIDEDTETRLPRVRGNVSFKRTIRRAELRQIVPVADTTIYEMEQRGEFPRRFYLTPRCVVWDLAEVEAWVEQRRHASDADMIKRAPSPDVRQRKSRPVRQ
jgi:prophage regulatory protein